MFFASNNALILLIPIWLYLQRQCLYGTIYRAYVTFCVCRVRGLGAIKKACRLCAGDRA